MTTTENTRRGVWISVDAVGTDYVRISADIPNDRLAAASRALAAVVNAPASPQVPASESVRERREVRRAHLAAAWLTEPYREAERVLVVLRQEGAARHTVVLTDEDATRDGAVAALARVLPDDGIADVEHKDLVEERGGEDR